MSRPFVELMANYEPYDHTKDPYAVDAHGNKVQLIATTKKSNDDDIDTSEKTEIQDKYMFDKIIKIPDEELLTDMTHKDRMKLFGMTESVYKHRIKINSATIKSFDKKHGNLGVGYKRFVEECIKQKQELDEIRDWINSQKGLKYKLKLKYNINFKGGTRRSAITPKTFEANRVLLNKLNEFKNSQAG